MIPISFVGQRFPQLLKVNCVCTPCFIFLVFCSHLLCWRVVLGTLLLKGACGNACPNPRGVCGKRPLCGAYLIDFKVQNVAREREQRTVFDLVEETLRRAFRQSGQRQLSCRSSSQLHEVIANISFAMQLCVLSCLSNVVNVICP